jgi:hypothetical protein
MLSIVSFMKTDAGTAVILMVGGIGNHVYVCTVKPRYVLKIENIFVQYVCYVIELYAIWYLVISVVVNSQSRISTDPTLRSV